MANLTFRDVRKHYGKTPIVHGVNFDVDTREFIVVLGPSGCGKSTLLRMVAGLEGISSGEICIDGKRVNDLEPRQRDCAMVFQNYALYPHMTVAENIGYALKVQGVGKTERDARIAAIAQTLSLEPYLDRRPAQLSGGQRQRVAIGRAMVRSPRVFLFDEPLSNLDAKLRVQMRIEIRKLHNRLGTTSIFVTHDQIEAMTLADRLLVMNAGVIEQMGTPQEIYRAPATRFVAGFVGAPAMNLMEGIATGPSEIAIGPHRLRVAHNDLTAGQELTIGIRPEQCTIAEGETGNIIPVTFDFSEELGSARLLHGSLQGEDFIVQVIGGAQSPLRGEHRIAVDPAAIHLFDRANGRRLPDQRPQNQAA